MDKQELKYLKSLKKILDDDLVSPAQLKAVVENLLELLKKSNEFHAQAIADQLAALQKEAQDIINRSLNESDTKRQEELTILVKKIYEEFKNVRDLIPPRIDPTPIYNRIIELERGLSRIPELDTAEEVRDKLETLEGDERLDKSAIKGLEDELKRIENLRATVKGGGGATAQGVRHLFKFIAHTEEPVGDIDGVNTTYTVKNEIFYVFGFTLNGEQVAQLPNFTYAGHTITFASAIPAVYSGKDFEIKYIG